MLGTPASNFWGRGAQVERVHCTSPIMLPPARKGGIASSSSRRPQRAPTPVGPSILCEERAKKSQPRACRSTGMCGTLWAPSTRTTAPAWWARRATSATGVIVPRTLETWGSATSLTRGLSSWA